MRVQIDNAAVRRLSCRRFRYCAVISSNLRGRHVVSAPLPLPPSPPAGYELQNPRPPFTERRVMLGGCGTVIVYCQ